METKNKRKYLYMGLIMLSIYLLTIILFDRFNVDDFIFHAKRISALAEEIKMHGLSGFPYRIYTVQMEGFGYGSPLFYGDLFLYIPAILVASGADVVLVLKVILFLCFPLSGITAYYLAKKLGFNSELSMFFSVVYMSSPYLACTVFIRQALGETYAIVLLPLVAMAIYAIMNKRDENRFLNVMFLSISMWCLVNVHSITTVLTVVFLFVYVLYMWIHKKDFKYFKSTFIDCFMAALIFMVLSASFLFPMLEQMLSLDLRGASGSDINIIQDNIIKPYELLFCDKSIGYVLKTLLNLGLIEGYSLKRKIGGGVFIVLTYLLIVFAYQKFIKKEKTKPIILFLVTTSLIIFLISTVPFLMNITVKVFPEIQFPFRLMSFASLLSSIALLYYPKDKSLRVKNNVLLLSIISSFLIVGPMLIEHSTKNDIREIEIAPEEVMDMGMLDYLQNSSVEHDGEKFIVFTNTYGNDFDRNDAITTVKVNREVKRGESLNFPLYYYKGYVAVFDNGDEIECFSNRLGHASIIIEENMYLKDVNVYYKGTNLQKISYTISCVGWVILTFFCVVVIRGKYTIERDAK